MDNRLEDKIKKAEGRLCGLVLKHPEILNDYNINKKLLSPDALFYIGVVDKLLNKNIEVVTELDFLSEIETFPPLVEKYTKMGGYTTIKELVATTDINNAESIYDEFSKWKLVEKYINKGILDLDQHFDKILRMKASQVVDYIEYQISDIDIDVNTDIEFEKLSYSDKELAELEEGINIGISYGKHSPLLNYSTLGIATSSIYLFGGYTNSGKSSYVFENMIMCAVENKVKSCVISNEQKSSAFKVLLLEHVLTERLNYWKCPRKKINMGKFTDEDKDMISKARDIIKNEYDPYITFVKVFDYDSKKIEKIVKKLCRIGVQLYCYDTFKASSGDDNNGTMWQKLLEDSKSILQIASKNDVAIVLTMQLALGSRNRQRFLDEGVLSNSKQVSEVIETGVYMRDLWQDEYDGEDYDVKPYRLKKDTNGKFTNEKEYIKLDKDKKYKLFFLSKTRSDENGQVLLYEFNGAFNKWHEVAKCTPHTKNMY